MQLTDKQSNLKIGIMTFHRAYNYGAFLQCYSLMKNMEEAFPEAAIEVIDYESTNMFNYYRTDLFSLMFGHSSNSQKLTFRYRLSKVKQFLKKTCDDGSYVKKLKERNQKFDNAIKQLNLSSKSLISDNEEEIEEFINSLDYDIIVVGSDAVWNDGQTSIDNPYYLGKGINACCVSYAASSYGMDYKEKTENQIKCIADRLSCFKYIGVRDKATEEYVKLLNIGKIAHHNCDPSILLDINTSDFENQDMKHKLEISGVNFSRPVFGIMGGDWLGKIARDLIPQDAQLVAIYQPNKYADLYLNNLSPFEWAKVFSMFKMTFTHFFHGTLFSLKNGTPTMSIEMNSDYSKKYDTKIVDVLKRMELEDFHYTKSQAESDFEVLKDHFEDVMHNLDMYKQRISKGIEKESAYYNDFIQSIRCLLRSNYE